MMVMGKYVSNFSIPVCSKFRPIVLKGRRCYQVDVNEFKDQVDLDKLMSHGLIFLLDYNNRSIGIKAKNPLEAVVEKDLGDMQKKGDNEDEAMIYIETLGMHNYTYDEHF